ncbi:chromate efflux transporter [Rhodobacteraceae bacterium XHP0102]|nr:chromate efflux transporter [Rhodobacteraceae bacterium XHP0102]
MSVKQQPPNLGALFAVFARIGILSFGGPAAQIALMHRELVETRDWLTERQFLSALSFTMLLPGPEAMQLATYAGWRLRGTLGGLIGGGLFVLPGAMVIMGLAALYALAQAVPWVDALFLGIKATVIVIVIQALFKLTKRALKGRVATWVAGMAFTALFIFDLPFPLVIAGAALIGYLGWITPIAAAQAVPPAPPANGFAHLAIWGGLWIAPLGLLYLTAPNGILLEIGLFFSKLALVTFGGAYAVLAYMVQEVVGDFGWLTTGQMMDVLGLAETTPGPLILVTQFVGFLAGFYAHGWGAAVLAALLTLWVTFIPCFLWIFLLAPQVERLTALPKLQAALDGVMAAVVGVIANLSLWFALNVWFGTVTRQGGVWLPDLGSVIPQAVILSVLAAALVWGGKLGMIPVLAIVAGLGVAISPFFG